MEFFKFFSPFLISKSFINSQKKIFVNMSTKKATLSASKDRFLNHYVKLPKTFFGEDWAKDTYGADYKKMYDLVKLCAFKKRGRGHQDCYLFELGNDSDYHLSMKDLLSFDAKGLVYSTTFHFVLSGLCCSLIPLCVCRFKTSDRRKIRRRHRINWFDTKTQER